MDVEEHDRALHHSGVQYYEYAIGKYAIIMIIGDGEGSSLEWANRKDIQKSAQYKLHSREHDRSR